MTSPEASAAVLTAVADWNVPLLRGAVTSLDSVTARLASWRYRVEALGRTLETAECWSGPAALAAGGALSRLSEVTTVVAGGLARSLDAFERLAAEGATAHELAAQALADAATVPGGLARVLAAEQDAAALDAVASALFPLRSGDDAPQSAAAGEALRHATAAAAAADEAGAALRRLGVVDAFAPATFADLTDRIGSGLSAPPPAVPRGRPPAEVAAWWAALPVTAQRGLIHTQPGRLGALDGVPAWARDRANRLLLGRALADPRLSPDLADTARSVAREIGELEDRGQPVQLHVFDLAGDRVAVALGDLDTADVVGLLVPGIGNSPSDDLGALTDDARDVADAARAAAPGLTVATVAWLGYRTPSYPHEVLTRTVARQGGVTLDASLDGLAAARGATGAQPARTTVLAHSYGTVVVDEAADATGRLAADAVVLLGSPGMEPQGAAGLEAPEVYDAAAPGDPIASSWWFGVPTWLDAYGSTDLPVDRFMGHSDYYDADRPTLVPMGEVVAGVRASE